MSEQDTRGLDQWLYANVPGLKKCKCVGGIRPKIYTANEYKQLKAIAITCGSKVDAWPDTEPDMPCDDAPRFTTEPTASMDVLKACVENGHMLAIEKTLSGVWSVAKVQCHDVAWFDFVTLGETLELAICLFAKKIFS